VIQCLLKGVDSVALQVFSSMKSVISSACGCIDSLMSSHERQREQNYNLIPLSNSNEEKLYSYNRNGMLQLKHLSIPACRLGAYCHAHLVAGKVVNYLTCSQSQ